MIRCVLLTAFDRPRLLRQSLYACLSQARALGVDLVVADDGSRDLETMHLLDIVTDVPGVTVLRASDRDLPGVFSTGRRFVTAVEWIRERYRDGDFVKVDDDVFLEAGCLERLVSTWSLVREDAPSLSAMLDVHTQPRSGVLPGGVVRTDWSSSVCCVHKIDLWAQALADLGPEYFYTHGWDVGFFWHWLDRRKHGQPLTIVPSLAYHAGHVGTRTARDVNRRPPDPFAMRTAWHVDRPSGALVDAE